METLTFGLMVTLIGLLIVFAGLALLIMLIKLMAVLTSGIGKKPKQAKKAQEPAAVIQPAAVQPVATTDAAPEQLIAVISAAVAAMLGEDSRFVVRRVRRVSNASPWQKAGREEQIYSRF